MHEDAICKKNWALSVIPSSSNNDALGFPHHQKLTLWDCSMSWPPSQSVIIWWVRNNTQKPSTFLTNSTFIIFAKLFNMLVWPWQILDDAFVNATFVSFKEKSSAHLLILSILQRPSLCAWMIHPLQGNRGTNSHSISRSAQWPASIRQYDTVIDHTHFWRPASWQWGWCQGSQMTTVLALKTCVYMQTRLLLYVGKRDTHLNSFLYAGQFNSLPLKNARCVSRPIAIQHQSVLLT